MCRWISLLHQPLLQYICLYSHHPSTSTPPPPPPRPPLCSNQITVIQAHGPNIIPPFDIVVLQSHSHASQLITLCTLMYTKACGRSFVNQLLFNYNFTWSFLISGANRVSPSAPNYSGSNCSACLWNMHILWQGHLYEQLLRWLLFEKGPAALEWLCERCWSGRAAEIITSSQTITK